MHAADVVPRPKFLESTMTTPSIAKLASSRGAPVSDTVPAPSHAPLLHSVHRTLIAALRHDYFSNGRGHLQSKPMAPAGAPKKPKVARAPEDASNDAVATIGEPAPLQAAEASLFDSAADAPPPATAADAGADIVTRYLADVATRRRLNSSEEYHLARQASEGHLEARQQLVEHHLGLVVMMAKRYLGSGMPLLDLIEEGNLGLIAASTKFDPELGHRFSTYAKWWIRQSIEMALMTQLRLVRLPIHLSRSIKQAARKQKQEQPQQANGSGAPAGVSADMVALLDNDDRDAGALIDELPAENEDGPEALLSVDQQRLQLQRVMAELNAKEQRVIQARFGLQQDEPRTLDDIARELGLSCERIRQIEKEALQKLRGLFSDQGIDLEAVL
jgi:RNA polymerase nonessential primary-like sigma factor